jgi:HEAT repeat protein
LLRDTGEAPAVRGVAAESLGRLGSPDVLDDLLAVLSDPEPQIMFFAAYALILSDGTGRPEHTIDRWRPSPGK